MTTNARIHDKAVHQADRKLIEYGITTRNGPGKGIDLILDNGKTVLIRGMSNEIQLALMHSSLDNLKSDYIAIVTNLVYSYPRMYIMTIDEAKHIACNMPNKSDGGDDWFINVSNYRQYINNYNVLNE